MDHKSKASLQPSQAVGWTLMLADARLFWVVFMEPALALLFLAMPVFAQTMPENASAKSYGEGWECHHGFIKLDDTGCVAVFVPDDGFLDHSGERWHCLRGLFKAEDTCQEVNVPESGYLMETSYGSAWECKRGFSNRTVCAKPSSFRSSHILTMHLTARDRNAIGDMKPPVQTAK